MFLSGDRRSVMVVPYSMQVCVGVIFLVIGGLDINRHGDQRAAIILNDVTLIMVFFISLINVVVSGFGMDHSSTRLREIQPPLK
jgi:surface polysaccharide O-acyltransferase-like enzyme